MTPSAAARVHSTMNAAPHMCGVAVRRRRSTALGSAEVALVRAFNAAVGPDVVLLQVVPKFEFTQRTATQCAPHSSKRQTIPHATCQYAPCCGQGGRHASLSCSATASQGTVHHHTKCQPPSNSPASRQPQRATQSVLTATAAVACPHYHASRVGASYMSADASADVPARVDQHPECVTTNR